jgi:hypothetical protein
MFLFVCFLFLFTFFLILWLSATDHKFLKYLVNLCGTSDLILLGALCFLFFYNLLSPNW